MMRNLLIGMLLALFLGSSGAFAQDDTAALAEKYVKLPAMQSFIDATFGQGYATNMLKAMGGVKLTDEQRTKLAAIVTEELAALRPKIEAAMARAASTTYSADELNAMIAFYSSKEGEAIMMKGGAYSQAYLAILGPALQELFPRLIKRAGEISQ